MAPTPDDTRIRTEGEASIRPRVVVIGAGFGGLACVERLGEAPVDVTLVDNNNFHTFQPLLYQVATAGLNSGDVAYPVRGIVRRHANVAFRNATVTGVDWDARVVTVRDEAGEQQLPFDHLVAAAGSTAHFFGLEGAAEHSFPLYSLHDAVALRNHLLTCYESADALPEMVDEGALTIVVVGGGPTGVEVAGALVELALVLDRDFATLDVARTKVVLVEQADELLGGFHESSRQHARRTLAARGVEVRTGVSVERITPSEVCLHGGAVIQARTVVWAAGIQASPLAGEVGAEQGRGGRLAVAEDLSMPGHPGGWALGDLAHIVPAGGGEPLPQLAQVAIQGGHHVARMIRNEVEGRPTEPFRYHDRGIMATIGRRAAVAELRGGIRLHGGIAWVAWLLLHLVTLLGLRNKLSVLVNWAWNYLTWDRGPRLIFGPSHASKYDPSGSLHA